MSNSDSVSTSRSHIEKLKEGLHAHLQSSAESNEKLQNLAILSEALSNSESHHRANENDLEDQVDTGTATGTGRCGMVATMSIIGGGGAAACAA